MKEGKHGGEGPPIGGSRQKDRLARGKDQKMMFGSMQGGVD